VGHAGIVHQPRGLQWPGPVAGEIEQPGSGSEQQVDEVNSHLVEEPRLQELTPEARTADEYDILAAGGCSRLREHAVDAVGDKRERASTRAATRVYIALPRGERAGLPAGV
jgi:hypothetical protein